MPIVTIVLSKWLHLVFHQLYKFFLLNIIYQGRVPTIVLEEQHHLQYKLYYKMFPIQDSQDLNYQELKDQLHHQQYKHNLRLL